jgi:hypothetical protein
MEIRIISDTEYAVSGVSIKDVVTQRYCVLILSQQE